MASKAPMILAINQFSISYEMLESICKCYGAGFVGSPVPYGNSVGNANMANPEVLN